MKYSRVGFFTFLFFFSFFSLSYGEVSVDKIDGLVDWNKPENYAEAKRAVKLAKEINAEKRRRKQLRDAGVGEEDIRRIIREERNKKTSKFEAKNVEKDNKNLKNNDNVASEDDDVGDDEDDDLDELKINDYSSNSNSRGTTARGIVGTAKSNQSFVVEDNVNGGYAGEQYERHNAERYSRQSNRQYSGYNRQNDFFGNRHDNSYNNSNNNVALVADNGGESRVADLKNNSAFATQGAEKNSSYLAMNEAKKTKDEFEKSIDTSNNGNYEDWELSRILSKAGNNVNDREKFLMFAREAGRIANRREKTSDFMDVDMLNADISYEFDDEGAFSANSRNGNSRYARYGGSKRYASSNNANKNLRNTKDFVNGQYYASGNSIVLGSRNNVGNNLKGKANNKMVVNEPARASGRFYASSRDEYKARIKDEGDKKYNVAIGKNTMTDKQIKAKNIGAPFPEKRENSNHKTQYLPQNIAQIAYDKNNRHLQPAVFEKDIISHAFDKLGDEDAIQTARALIDKFGNVDIADEDGNTLLMHAVARGNQSLVATLLAEGANPNALNNEGFAPIHLASSNGDNVAIYSMMMNNGNPNLRDKDGNTALMYASKICNADTIKLMISFGGDPSIENRATGKTAFDFASENSDPLVITLLERKTENMFRKRKPVDLAK